MSRLLVTGLALTAAGFALAPEAEAEEYCREYQRKVIINGEKQDAYGMACLQPDGEWKIVNSSDIQAVHAPEKKKFKRRHRPEKIVEREVIVKRVPPRRHSHNHPRWRRHGHRHDRWDIAWHQPRPEPYVHWR